MNRLLIITGTQRSKMDESLSRLADWIGLEAQVERVPELAYSTEGFTKMSQAEQTCVAFSADTLDLLLHLSNTGSAWAKLVLERSSQCLVYGFRSCPSHAAGLNSLTGGRISGPEPLPGGARRFRFSTEGKTWLHSLSGIAFTEECGDVCDAFNVISSTIAECTPLLLAEDRPVFIHWKPIPERDLFLWATTRIADVGAPISRETAPERDWQCILPAIIFLKASYGSRCWHNPNLRARLIIDDPPLHSRYGFLRYDELVDSMQRLSYGTSIAFIPWNYRRSRKAAIRLFLRNATRLSLCVHGCDHTKGEFDCDDENHLTQKANLALHRMRQHRESSGIQHEKVMVFPQGLFSVAAIRALRKSGFLAVVNSTCYPGHYDGTFLLGDLLLPAMCRFHGFPIFPRRDATRIVDIAVDLFLGRAAFVGEHHEFAREGYHKWEAFVAEMNSLVNGLAWPRLTDTITESCLQKVAGQNRMDVWFFTYKFRWCNQSKRPVRAHLTKFDPEPMLIKQVRVGGEILPFELKGSFIHFDILVPPNNVIDVEVLDEERQPIIPFNAGVGYRVGAGLRRYMSEFRDNRLARHPQLLGYAKTVARYFKLTGDSS